MNPKRTAAPLAEPVTLAEAKTHLRVTTSDEDAYITGLVAVARTACEDRLERTLVSTAWEQVLDTFPPAIRLLNPPILAVQSIQFRDAAGAWVTLSPADYVVDTASEPGYVVPAPGTQWPEVYQGVNHVRVAYTAGYGSAAVDVPAPLRHWVLLALTDLYEQRSRSADKPAVPQVFADGLLDTYRMWGV